MMESNSMQHVMDIVHGRWRSQILFTGVQLGVFDFLQNGRHSADDAALNLGLHPRMTYRLMRALACIDLLNESQEHLFSVSPSGEYLCSNHPQSLRDCVLLEESAEHYAIWKHLSDIIRSNHDNGFIREYGHLIFEHTGHCKEYGAVFNNAMNSYSKSETELFMEAIADFDFSEISTICDVGGGYGYLLCTLLKKYPEIRGIVLDLENVIDDQEKLFANQMGLTSQCQYQSGDMFQEVPSADGYLLKHILHDWNDEECIQILTNMNRAASENAKLLITECIVPGPKTPHFS